MSSINKILFLLRTRWRIRLLPRGDTRIISLRVRRGREESNTFLSLIIYFILRLWIQYDPVSVAAFTTTWEKKSFVLGCERARTVTKCLAIWNARPARRIVTARDRRQRGNTNKRTLHQTRCPPWKNALSKQKKEEKIYSTNALADVANKGVLMF